MGFRRNGQALALRAALGFGMPVQYHSRRPVDLEQELPELAGKALHTPLNELLQRADIVAAVLPLSSETRGLMGAREFGLMKPGAIFINGARGAIVQEDALLAALDHGTARAAGLALAHPPQVDGATAHWFGHVQDAPRDGRAGNEQPAAGPGGSAAGGGV